MTILKALSLADLATGDRLDAIGFTDYAALKVDLSYQATDPDWRRDTAAADSLANDASGADISLQPRTLWENAAAIIRTEVRMNEPVSSDYAEFVVLLAKDDKNFIALARTGFPGTQILGFVLVEGGVQKSAADFPYGIWYNSGFTRNQYATLPATITVAAVVNGTNLDIYVDGVKQFIRNTTTGAVDIATVPIPASVQGGKKVGYWHALFSNKRYAPYLAVRDNSGRTEINSYRAIRGDVTRSKLRIGGLCNVAGASTVQVDIYNAGGGLVASGGGSVTGGGWSVDIGPIPTEYENTTLRVVARNQGGTVDTSSVLFAMPETIAQAPFKIGINETGPMYYLYYPYNDLSKICSWRYGANFVRTYWMDQYPALFPADPSWKPASDIGLTPNGNPTKFPASGDAIGMLLPYHPGEGEKVLDFSAAPDLDFRFDLLNGLVTVTRDFYGRGKHKVEVAANYIPPAGAASWNIFLYPDATKPNKGLPVGEWSWSFKSVGASDEMVWNRAYVEWLEQLAPSFIRYMSSQVCNHAIDLKPGAITAEMRCKPESQLWTGAVGISFVPAHPVENIVQLHNHLGIDIWDTISDAADESYVRQRFGYYRDHLSADRKIYVEISNERWNYSFGQTFRYVNEGLTKGLGFKIAAGCLSDAVFGVETGPHTIPAEWGTGAYTTGQQVLSDLHIFQAKTNITSNVANAKPGLDGARWQKIQDGLVALRRAHINDSLTKLSYIEDEFGADYAARIVPVFAVWDALFDGDFGEYLEWGENWRNFQHLAVGAYFGAPDLQWSSLTAEQKAAIEATTGDARVEVIKAIARPGVDAEIARYADHARQLKAKLVALGAPPLAVRMAVYEGGEDWYMNLKDASGDDAVLFADMISFRRAGMYQLQYDFYKGLNDAAGGIMGHFDMVTPIEAYFPSMPGDGLIHYFGISKDLWDRASTSASYRALRDLSVTFGGGSVVSHGYPSTPPPVPGGGFARYPVGFFLE